MLGHMSDLPWGPHHEMNDNGTGRQQSVQESWRTNGKAYAARVLPQEQRAYSRDDLNNMSNGSYRNYMSSPISPRPNKRQRVEHDYIGTIQRSPTSDREYRDPASYPAPRRPFDYSQIPKGPKGDAKGREQDRDEFDELEQVDLDNPHIVIPARCLPPSRKTLPHVARFILNKTGLQPPIKITEHGYYIVFFDSKYGDSDLETLYERCNGQLLFGMYALHMERYPSNSADKYLERQDLRSLNSVAERLAKPRHEELSRTRTNLSQTEDRLSDRFRRVHNGHNEMVSAILQKRDLIELERIRKDSAHDARLASKALMDSPTFAQRQGRIDDDLISNRSVTSSEMSSITRRELEKVCYGCKLASNGLNPLVKCSSCWRRFHETCRIPRAAPAQLGVAWYCKHCIKLQRHTEGTTRQEGTSSTAVFPRRPSTSQANIAGQDQVADFTPLKKPHGGVFQSEAVLQEPSVSSRSKPSEHSKSLSLDNNSPTRSPKCTDAHGSLHVDQDPFGAQSESRQAPRDSEATEESDIPMSMSGSPVSPPLNGVPLPEDDTLRVVRETPKAAAEPVPPFGRLDGLALQDPNCSRLSRSMEQSGSQQRCFALDACSQEASPEHVHQAFEPPETCIQNTSSPTKAAPLQSCSVCNKKIFSMGKDGLCRGCRDAQKTTTKEVSDLTQVSQDAVPGRDQGKPNQLAEPRFADPQSARSAVVYTVNPLLTRSRTGHSRMKIAKRAPSKTWSRSEHMSNGDGTKATSSTGHRSAQEHEITPTLPDEPRNQLRTGFEESVAHEGCVSLAGSGTPPHTWIDLRSSEKDLAPNGDIWTRSTERNEHTRNHSPQSIQGNSSHEHPTSPDRLPQENSRGGVSPYPSHDGLKSRDGRLTNDGAAPTQDATVPVQASVEISVKSRTPASIETSAETFAETGSHDLIESSDSDAPLIGRSKASRFPTPHLRQPKSPGRKTPAFGDRGNTPSYEHTIHLAEARRLSNAAIQSQRGESRNSGRNLNARCESVDEDDEERDMETSRVSMEPELAPHSEAPIQVSHLGTKAPSAAIQKPKKPIKAHRIAEPGSLKELGALAIANAPNERVSSKQAVEWILAQKFPRFGTNNSEWQGSIKAKFSGSFKKDTPRPSDNGLVHYTFRPGQKQLFKHLFPDDETPNIADNTKNPGKPRSTSLHSRDGTTSNSHSPSSRAPYTGARRNGVSLRGRPSRLSSVRSETHAGASNLNGIEDAEDVATGSSPGRLRGRKRARRHSSDLDVDDETMHDQIHPETGEHLSISLPNSGVNAVVERRLDSDDSSSDSDDRLPDSEYFTIVRTHPDLNHFDSCDLFAARPDLDPDNAFDVRARREEIRARPTRGQRKRMKKLGYYVQPAMAELPDRRKQSLPWGVECSSDEDGSQHGDDDMFDPPTNAKGNTLRKVKTIEEVFGLPSFTIPVIDKDGDLAFRDGTRVDGELPRARQVWKVGRLEERNGKQKP